MENIHVKHGKQWLSLAGVFGAWMGLVRESSLRTLKARLRAVGPHGRVRAREWHSKDTGITADAPRVPADLSCYGHLISGNDFRDTTWGLTFPHTSTWSNNKELSKLELLPGNSENKSGKTPPAWNYVLCVLGFLLMLKLKFLFLFPLSVITVLILCL